MMFWERSLRSFGSVGYIMTIYETSTHLATYSVTLQNEENGAKVMHKAKFWHMNGIVGDKERTNYVEEAQRL